MNKIELIPEHMRESVSNYVIHRIEPGGFLTAVICNDLKNACARADLINRNRLFDIVAWFYNEAPSDCWGSGSKMAQWLNREDEVYERP